MLICSCTKQNLIKEDNGIFHGSIDLIAYTDGKNIIGSPISRRRAQLLELSVLLSKGTHNVSWGNILATWCESCSILSHHVFAMWSNSFTQWSLDTVTLVENPKKCNLTFLHQLFVYPISTPLSLLARLWRNRRFASTSIYWHGRIIEGTSSSIQG